MTQFVEGLVSIITPAYNAAAFLDETIHSVICQSYRDWEMLIVDDCSKDNTRELIQGYVNRDQRVKLLTNGKNRGPAETRNNAIEHACGQYIAFLDSDDTWHSEKLKKQLEFMKMNCVAFSYTGFRRISENEDQLGHKIHVPETINYYGLLKNTAIATSTVVIDRSVTGNFRMIRTYYDDIVLWLEILKRGFSASGLDEDLMRYRVVGGSVSRNKGRSAYKVWRTYRDIEQIGSIKSLWYFVNYAWNAVKKYARF